MRHTPEEIAARRARPPLELADLGADPIAAFRAWYAAAAAAGLAMPEAVTLATATPAGAPSLRWVLLKDVDDAGGFSFFTSYEGRKGVELAANPRAALAFFWEPLERQVRIEGMVARVSDAESDAYWATRPRDSRLAAVTSQQSRPVADRAAMQAAYAANDALWPGDAVPRPAHWGGYRLHASAIEFWQGQANRFHDRFRFERADAARSEWTVARLWP
jgi:pyridoxamine 5'-phosphate oxidase